MSFDLTNEALIQSQKNQITPNIVVQIEGLSTLIGAIPVTKKLRIGDEWAIGDVSSLGIPLVIGGLLEFKDQVNVMDLNGSSTTLSQQLRQSQGGTQSTTVLDFKILDFNGFATNLVSPGKILNEILAKKATVYLGFANTAFPESFIPVLQGTVDSVRNVAGGSILSIAHPENLKRQDIFEPMVPKTLTAQMNDTQTGLTVNETISDFFTSHDCLTSYISIDDEIMLVNSIGPNTFSVVRAQLGTTAVIHEAGAKVSSFYRFQENAIDLALKFMVSGSDSPFVSGIKATSFVKISEELSVANAVYFQGVNLQLLYGIVAGDFITITGATNGPNNVTNVEVIEIFDDVDGQFIVIDASLVLEETTSAEVSFDSKYNVLNDGLAMDPTFTDVVQHEKLKSLFAGQIADYDFRLTDAFSGEDINTQIYWPSALYSLPRKGRASIGITFPPLADSNTVTLDADRVKNGSKIITTRSVNKDFYNAIVYKIDKENLGDKYKSGVATFLADSISRFKRKGIQKLQIESLGMRENGATIDLINRNTQRIKDRYQFAAESIDLEVDFRSGFAIEVGDTVVMGDEKLKFVDIESGDRKPSQKIYECVQKRMNIKTGSIQLTLQQTNYNTDGRYGVIGPSSYINTGSTASVIKLKRSFGTSDTQFEIAKWRDFVGQPVIVHNDDWTIFGESFIDSVGGLTADFLNLSPALPFTPGENYLLEMPFYPENPDPKFAQPWKQIHVFIGPQVSVTSGVSQFIFNVALADAPKFFIGCQLVVHDEGFTVVSPESKVTDISGGQITVETDLGFVPSNIHLVDLIGVSADGGAPYRYI